MHLGGLVLDVYDDQRGEILKAIYPTRGDVPHLVKTAHALSPEERAELPDDVFALVLMNDGGDSLRKFACVDPGNTVLAVEYFLCNKDKLPLEAQKLAAVNLVTMCGWYDLPPPVELRKIAEVSGTVLMPGQESTDKDYKSSKAVVKKTAAVGHLVQGKEKHPRSESPEMLEQNAWRTDKNPQERQHHQITPHINVQGAEPPSPTKMKVSQITALPGRYPLDSYEQVKTASVYFDEYWARFDPEDRHEYCLNMVKRADDLSIPVSDLARKYGSATYAPEEETAFALDARKALLSSDAGVILDKLAFVRDRVEPEVFALTLQEFDKTAGLQFHYDRDVPDPFYSTFGFEKEAEYSEAIGNDYINESRLKELAIGSQALLCKRFGKDMVEEFRKDPVGIFKSLPMEQKKIIMRLASDEQPGTGQS